MRRTFAGFKWICVGLVGLGVLAVFGLYGAVSLWPSLGAQGADLLRSCFGNEVVIQLENSAFHVKDTTLQIKYAIGLEKPAAPWQLAESKVSRAATEPEPQPTAMPLLETTASVSQPTATATIAAASPTPLPTPVSIPVPSPLNVIPLITSASR